MSSHLIRKHDSKRGIKYTLLVIGSSGTGKTTFINTLLNSNILPHRYQQVISSLEQPEILSYIGDFNYQHDLRHFNPHSNLNNDDPTLFIQSSKTELVDEDGSKIQLTIIDTPGFGDNLNNELCFNEILSFLQQQFDHVLAEETRVKRNPKFEDTRVHLCLYFLEPTGHGLRELDVECMKKLSKFVNILPIISKADSFTTVELHGFKKNVLYDIKKFNIPIFEFNYDEEEDDLEIIQELKNLQNNQPFAIISSREKHLINGELKISRKYPWGLIDVEENSDFNQLKNVLFSSHLQDFKDLTTNFLYENYRTEKLSSVTSNNGVNPSSNKDLNSVNPSLSNLAALTLEENQIKKEKADDDISIKTPSVRSSASFKADFQTSPIKELSKSIREDNESIISSIKNSPHLQYSPDPNRNKLRVISETVPYVLKHERILSRQLKLQELEEKSARELSIRAAALEKRAADLKKRERLLKGSSIVSLKKEETLTDLSSIVKQEDV